MGSAFGQKGYTEHGLLFPLVKGQPQKVIQYFDPAVKDYDSLIYHFSNGELNAIQSVNKDKSEKISKVFQDPYGHNLILGFLELPDSTSSVARIINRSFESHDEILKRDSNNNTILTEYSIDMRSMDTVSTVIDTSRIYYLYNSKGTMIGMVSELVRKAFIQEFVLEDSQMILRFTIYNLKDVYPLELDPDGQRIILDYNRWGVLKKSQGYHAFSSDRNADNLRIYNDQGHLVYNVIELDHYFIDNQLNKLGNIEKAVYYKVENPSDTEVENVVEKNKIPKRKRRTLVYTEFYKYIYSFTQP